jgi:site-specific recombinase XerD
MDIEKLVQWEQTFLRSLKLKGKSPNSLKSYRLDFQCLHDFLAEKQNKNSLEDFNAQTLRNFEHFLSEKYSNINSIRRKVQTLRLFFDYLVQKKQYPENPIKKLIIAPKSVYPPTPLSPLEVIVLLESSFISEEKDELEIQKFNRYRNLILFILIYDTGLKISDLTRLKKKDLLLNHDSSQARILVSPPKRDPYTIPISPEYFEFIISYLDLLKTTSTRFSQLFFNSNAYKILSGGISARGIENIFNNWSEVSQVKVTPKTLRQTCVMNWLKKEKTQSQIKEWLGLSPSYSLDAYTKLFKQGPIKWSYSQLQMNHKGQIQTIKH